MADWNYMSAKANTHHGVEAALSSEERGERSSHAAAPDEVVIIKDEEEETGEEEIAEVETAEMETAGVNQLEMFYDHARELGYLNTLITVLPQIDDYTFVVNSDVRSATRLHPEKLFMGEDNKTRYQIWAVLGLMHTRAAEVIFTKELEATPRQEQSQSSRSCSTDRLPRRRHPRLPFQCHPRIP
ncbi:hypothetical protein K491DRAFT_505160 [Lophiostoma macrostomum CBS 122681]|uniref:Uncharacterized protein n=1 Tax=Lophiostoma macrostomum CBS 122681 TaxID=1314788 RepID=A0A6A6TME7_9PLEO|nr:hypothetical protein K491DRAFT_505160 [Lophiostoma macrostomum CBS 122681]